MSEMSGQGAVYIGAEVLASGIRAVCLSSNNEILEKTLLGGGASSEALTDFVRSAIERHGSLAGTGLASPSGTEPEAVRVSNDLFKLSGNKPVQITSAYAGSYGELKMGAGRGSSDIFYITLGTPVCAAIVLGGSVWSGSRGLPCDFESIVIDSEGRKIGDFTTDESLLRRTRNRFNQDDTSSLVPFDEKSVTVADLIKEALKGDDLALMMLERTGRFAGAGVAVVINLLNVQKVIIGGAIALDGTNVVEGVREGARELSSPTAFESVEILAAELGVFSAAVGAALTSAGK